MGLSIQQALRHRHPVLGYATPLKFLEERTVVTAGDKNVRKGGCVTNHMNEYIYLFEAR